jgi:hypothetical protein
MEQERRDEPVEGHRRLAFEVLSRAFDDICPVEEPGEQLKTPEEREAFMREQLEVIKQRVQRYQIYETELDREWDFLEKQSQLEYEKFVAERDSTFERIRSTHNVTRIVVGVSRYESQKRSRINSIHSRINSERAIYLKRVEKIRERGDTVLQQDIDTKLREFDRILQHRVKATTERYDSFIRNLESTDNGITVQRRIENSKLVWKRREAELVEKWKVREANHNSKRMEFDQIRLAVDWFTYDVDKVAFWCDVAQIPLIQCYEGVKRRLDLIGRHVQEFEETLKQVKAGEFHDLRRGFRRAA